MIESSEVLDLVNSTDTVIGQITRGEVPSLFTATGQYIRYANCFLQNCTGALWIPKRVSTKTIAPNGLDFSASEHVGSGEEYLAAAVRGLQEELNIQVDSSALTLIGKLTPDNKRPYFSSIFTLSQDEAPQFNSDDFTGYEWLTPQDLLHRLATGAIAKDDLFSAVELVLAS